MIQITNHNITNKILFLFGLLFILISQFMLAKGNDFVYSQKPIDFAHWFLLVGVVLMIPQIINFPKSVFSFIGIPLALIGIVCNIGMCVLDFLWWSFPTDELRNDFTNHISQIPSIWNPFITIGPSSKIFNLGLMMLSLNYFKSEKIAIGINVLAILILWHVIPVPFRLIFGYLLTFLGFSLVFLRPNKT